MAEPSIANEMVQESVTVFVNELKEVMETRPAVCATKTERPTSSKKRSTQNRRFTSARSRSSAISPMRPHSPQQLELESIDGDGPSVPSQLHPLTSIGSNNTTSLDITIEEISDVDNHGDDIDQQPHEPAAQNNQTMTSQALTKPQLVIW
jgi:hypothetical protein